MADICFCALASFNETLFPRVACPRRWNQWRQRRRRRRLAYPTAFVTADLSGVGLNYRPCSEEACAFLSPPVLISLLYFLSSRSCLLIFSLRFCLYRNHLAVGAAVVQGQRRSSDRRRPQRLQQPRHNRSRRRFRSRHLSSKRRSRLPRCCSGSPGSSRALPPSRRATTRSSPEMRQRPSPATLRQPPRLLAPDRQIPPPFPL